MLTLRVISEAAYGSAKIVSLGVKIASAPTPLAPFRSSSPPALNNGPLVPELKEIFPDALHIARPGQINAWDNEDFVKATKATGRKQLIIAGSDRRLRDLPDIVGFG